MDDQDPLAEIFPYNTAKLQSTEGMCYSPTQKRTAYSCAVSREDALPGAKTHDVITIVTGIALVPLAYATLLNLSQSPEVSQVDTGLLVGAHLLSGIMFSPDLDIDSAIDNRWGMFYWIWRPYMWAVPHRSRWLSHGLIFAPLLRLSYFFTAVTLIYLGVVWALKQLGFVAPYDYQQAVNALLLLASTQPLEVLVVLIGFITGSAAHTIADWLVTGGKRYLRWLGLRVTKNYAHHDQTRRYR